MAKVKVYAPNREFRGMVGGVQFAEGKGEVDEASPVLRYFTRAGYGIGQRPGEQAAAAQPDSRQATEPQQVGTPLRDAAVDPRPEDFLPPVNAGQADPHGPAVVAPQIHAEGPKGIKPGEVYVHDTATQQAKESALAKAVLIEGQDKTVAVPAAHDEPDTSPAAEAARRPATAAPAPQAAAQPARNAAQAAWVDYAVAQGAQRAEVEDLKRDDLIERYGSE